MEENKEIVVNTKEITHKNRKEIMEEEEKQLPSFEDVKKMAGFNRTLEYIQSNNQLSYSWNFGPKSLTTFIKRVIRKVMKCVLMPLIVHQNALNYRFTNCMNVLQHVYNENIMLKKELAALQKKQLEQEAAINMLLGKEKNQTMG